MNLTVDGDSNYVGTGIPDVYTAVSNGPAGSDGLAEHINGIAKAITQLQALLGNAPNLKGSVADLVTRLSKVIGADGAFVNGVAFPGTPIDGQPFYRTDLNILYIYDAATGQWISALVDTNTPLLDGSRNFIGDIAIKKAVPGLRLIGQEASAKDLLIREDTGFLVFLHNTGSEGVPAWTERFRIDMSAGKFQFGGTGAFKAIFAHANGADRTYTLPDFAGVLATLAGVEALSNKTLSSSVINPLVNTITLSKALATANNANQTAEQDLLSYVLPGGLLGTTKGVRITVWVTQDITVSQFTYRLKYGGTTLATIVYPAPAENGMPVKIEAVLVADALTNAQRGSILGLPPVAGAAAQTGTSAIDSTVDQTIKITQAQDVTGTFTTKRFFATVEGM